MAHQESYTYKYPRAALTVDAVVIGFTGTEFKILLIERGLDPYKGMWALPGGFVKMDETLEEAVRRELREETGLTDIYLEQMHAFSEIGRDPRERVITVAFLAIVKPEMFRPSAGDDASNALWFPLDSLPPLAFDHAEIIKIVEKKLPKLLNDEQIVACILGGGFTMAEIQRLYEIVNKTTYDRRNFQKKLLQTGMVKEQNAPAKYDDFCASSCSFATPKRTKRLYSLDIPNDDDNETTSSLKDILNW